MGHRSPARLYFVHHHERVVFVTALADETQESVVAALNPHSVCLSSLFMIISALFCRSNTSRATSMTSGLDTRSPSMNSCAMPALSSLWPGPCTTTVG